MRANRQRRRILRIASTITIMVALALVGCAIARRRSQAADALDPEYIVAAAIGDLSASASASGRLLPQQEAQLVLDTPGLVSRVYVSVGDAVAAGDVLVELESGEVQRAVESAEQDLAIKEANLAELVKAPDADDVNAAQAALANAQAQLDDLLAGPSEEELAQAQASLQSAQARLDDLLAGPGEEELAQARAALVSAQASLEVAKARYKAQDGQLVIAQNDIHNAQLAVDRARDMYDQLIWNSRDPLVADSWGPYTPQAGALRNAEINYDVAVANYDLAKIELSDATVRSAQAQVAQAEAAHAALTDERTAQIASAEAQLARAEANLVALTDEKTVQIASVRAQLAQAQANLTRLLDGPSQEQIAIARAQVEQSRIALEEALDMLESAALAAPFAGTVTAVHVAVGEYATGLAVELVDTDSLRVVLDVDEVDIGTIRVGQPTIISLETWPQYDLPGEVVSIAPKAKTVGGIVTYEVQLSFDARQLPVLTGMTANADLITAQRTDVLLVPNRAIVADRMAGRYYVNKVIDDQIVKTEVTIGLRDNTYTEVTGGLVRGEQVYIGTIEEAIDFRSGPPSGVREFRGQ